MLFLTSNIVQVKTILSRKLKIKLHRLSQTIILLLYCMGVERGRRKETKRLVIFEKKILRRIFGTKNNIESNEYERRTNLELRKGSYKPDIAEAGYLAWQGMCGERRTG